MKVNKKVLCLLLSFCMVLSLIGCVSQSKGVTDSQLKEDIKNSSFIQDCFSSEYIYESEYSYLSHDIIKRQTNVEEKEDIIYCNVTAENKYFSVDFEVTLEYVYYDDGGWILEKSNITKKTPTPIAAAEKDLIVEEIFEEHYYIAYVKWYKNPSSHTPTLQNGYMGELEVERDEEDPIDYLCHERSYYSFGTPQFDKENLCTLLPTNYCIGEIVKTEGDFRLFFDEKKGWTFLDIYIGESDGGRRLYNTLPILEINDAQFNCSSTLGDFGFEYYTGEWKTEYSIKEINTELECVHFLRRSHQVGHTDEMIETTSDIDLFTMEINFGNGIFYNPQKDTWTYHSIGNDREYTRIK